MAHRKIFEMSEEDLVALFSACRPPAMIATHCGQIASQQENANAAWKALGDKQGFDHMTAEPVSNDPRFFSAIPTNPTK